MLVQPGKIYKVAMTSSCPHSLKSMSSHLLHLIGFIKDKSHDYSVAGFKYYINLCLICFWLRHCVNPAIGLLEHGLWLNSGV